MSSYRFDLEKALAAWRRTLHYNRAFLADDLDELEQHLRDQVAALTAEGASEETAFRQALAEMGDYGVMEGEYEKVYWSKRRRRHELRDELYGRTAMLKNYLTVALRHVRRHKTYALINTLGLAVGLACCLLIGLYVYHAWSYDRFHTRADRIYRVVTDYQTPGEHMQLLAPGMLAPTLEADFPEVLRTVRFAPARFLLARDDRRFQEDHLRYADSTVFAVFDFALTQGNPATALSAPYQVVLTQSTARKYFGEQDPVGQTLTADGKHLLTVTGVMADVPSNSHLQFDGLVSMATHEALEAWRFQTFLSSIYFATYVLLPEDYAPAVLEAKLPGFVARHTRRAFEEQGLQDNELAYELEPLTAIYFNPPRQLEPRPAGNATYVYLFSCIAVFILLIACINFMNLATARSTDRAKEVGLRKVVGAHRLGLVAQFLAESFLMTGLATALAFGLAAAALPAFRVLSGKVLPTDWLFHPAVLLALLSAAAVVGLLAGSYPSFVLSGFQPAAVLKGAFRTSPAGVHLRKGLVVFQFGIAVVLIAGTAVVFTQLDYLRRQRLGFNTEQMLVIDFHSDPSVRTRAESIKRRLAEHPAVIGSTETAYVPGETFDTFGRSMETSSGERRNVSLGTYEVDYDFLSVYGLELLAGRNFSPDFPGDSTRALILNETAARHLGFSHPQDAVGAAWGWGTEEMTGRVIGVVKDFHFQSLHDPVSPLALQFIRFTARYLTLRVHTAHLSQTVADLEQTWRQLVPHRPFDYSFLDETFDAQYRADVRFGQLFGTFAGLAIFVACLGLFGLATFTAEQRTKEIGVRKVLGATVPSIVLLLSKDFARLVIVAFLLAAPVAYLGMNRWLDDFAYRVTLGPGVFLLAGGLALVIALLTVSYQSVKAALANPAGSLRSE